MFVPIFRNLQHICKRRLNVLRPQIIEPAHSIAGIYKYYSLYVSKFITETGFQDVFYIRAHIWNIRNFKDTLKERRKVQFMRKVPDSVLQRNMLKKSAKLDTFRRIGAPQFKSESL